MSRIRANKITNKIGTGAVELEKGAHLPIGMGITGAGGLNITGVVTATSFSGSGANLTGIDATSIKDSGGNVKVQAQASGAVYTGIHTFNSDIDVDGHTNLDNVNVAGVTTFAGGITGTTATFSGNVSIGGTLTYEDVTNIDSVGIVTAREGIFLPDNKKLHIGNAAGTGDLQISHNGSTSNLIQSINSKNLVIQTNAQNSIIAKPGAAVELYHAGNKKFETSSSGASVTGTLSATAFSGDGSALTGIDVGLSTEALTTAGGTVTLDLTKDDHKITKSGTYTITCTGGSEGGSHSLRIENSGTSSVSFSSYFKFPSGGTPSLPTTNGAISLISFTVHKAGSVGVNTVLLAGASVNYS